MIEIKWTKHKRLSNLINQLARLDNQSASYGYFKEQGNHPESPNLTYAQLMSMHELREDELKRPVFQTAISRHGKDFEGHNLKALKSYVDKSALSKRPSPKTLLDSIAIKGIEITKPIFGDPTILKSNTIGVIKSKGRNTPMVEFGILKEALSYKTSLRKNIKRFY